MNTHDSEWVRWPIAWSAIWVGALTALAVGLIIGLVGLAIGANEVARDIDWKKVRLITLIFSIGGAFFAFVAGGWTAARIAGVRRSEPAMLHGAIVWLVALPLLLALAVVGATANFGGWYGSLAGTPSWMSVVAPPDPTLAAAATRNSALASVVALLLGVAGAVIGGWVASGEPMTFMHHRKRDRELRSRTPLTETVHGRPR